jgi:hypothetical protein
MSGALFTKVSHFLDEKGELPSDLPGPARKLAEFICSIVQSVTSHTFEALVPTGICCRRRPKRKPCKGEILAFLNEETKAIQWNCPVCGDNGFIYDWEVTNWDIRFSDIIPVRFHMEEKDLILTETLIGPDLTDRLNAAKEVSEVVVVYFGSDELDDLIDHIAAAANHCTDSKIQEDLDSLYDSLSALLDFHLDRNRDLNGGKDYP